MLVLRTHVSSDDALAYLGNPPEVPAGQRPTRMCSSKVQQPHRTGTTVAVPRRTTDLRQRPSMTALPLDGKERVSALTGSWPGTCPVGRPDMSAHGLSGLAKMVNRPGEPGASRNPGVVHGNNPGP